MFGFSSPKKSRGPKMPKWPKGLKARLAKAKRRKEQLAKVEKRRREIDAARKALAKF